MQTLNEYRKNLLSAMIFYQVTQPRSCPKKIADSFLYVSYDFSEFLMQSRSTMMSIMWSQGQGVLKSSFERLTLNY